MSDSLELKRINRDYYAYAIANKVRNGENVPQSLVKRFTASLVDYDKEWERRYALHSKGESPGRKDPLPGGACGP